MYRNPCIIAVVPTAALKRRRPNPGEPAGNVEKSRCIFGLFGCFVDPTPLILRYRVWRGAAAIQERRRVSPIRRAALNELASPNDAAIQATVRKPATNEP
jgi:hypothetical protein